MTGLIIGLLVRLTIGLVLLAVRITAMVGFAVGRIAVGLLGMAWRSMHRQRVPAQSIEFPTEYEQEPSRPRPPTPPRSSFTPRPIRPRPRR